MRKSYLEPKDYILTQITHEDRTLLLTQRDGFYGLTICETKKAGKKKIIEYDHLLLKYTKLCGILREFHTDNNEYRQYFSCECRNEILRIWHFPKDDKEEEKWCFEIFDNYFLKCPRGIKDSIELNIYDIYKLQDAINLDGKSDRLKKRLEQEGYELMAKYQAQGFQFTNCHVKVTYD